LDHPSVAAHGRPRRLPGPQHIGQDALRLNEDRPINGIFAREVLEFRPAESIEAQQQDGHHNPRFARVRIPEHLKDLEILFERERLGEPRASRGTLEPVYAPGWIRGHEEVPGKLPQHAAAYGVVRQLPGDVEFVLQCLLADVA
jgi:hypothetical protein